MKLWHFALILSLTYVAKANPAFEEYLLFRVNPNAPDSKLEYAFSNHQIDLDDSNLEYGLRNLIWIPFVDEVFFFSRDDFKFPISHVLPDEKSKKKPKEHYDYYPHKRRGPKPTPAPGPFIMPPLYYCPRGCPPRPHCPHPEVAPCPRAVPCPQLHAPTAVPYPAVPPEIPYVPWDWTPTPGYWYYEYYLDGN